MARAGTASLRCRLARLRRVLDSVDVCQSVLANFFVRVAAGQFDLDQPEQLLRLLATMARNRILDHVKVTLPRPRTYTSPDFNDYRVQLTAELEREVMRAYDRDGLT